MKNIKNIILGVILFCSFGLLSDENKEALFIEDINIVGIISNNESINLDIKNGIAITIADHFKEKYILYDRNNRDKLLKDISLLQKLGKSEEELKEAMKSSATDVKYKIVGTIYARQDDYVLHFKLYEYGAEKKTKEVKFGLKSDQFNYYAKELTRSLLSPEYSIPNAPPKLEDLKEVKNDAIESKDLNESEFSQYISLQSNADENFENKEYINAIKGYEAIINSIGNDIPPERKDRFKSYLEKIKERNENAYYNMFSLEIKKIDELYKKGKFEDAIREYEKIKSQLYTRPWTSLRDTFLARIKKRIIITNSTATAFLENRINVLLASVQKNNIAYGLAKTMGKNKEKVEAEYAMKDSLKSAKTELSSPFSNSKMIELYNKMVTFVNEDKDVLFGEVFYKGYDSAISRSILFPGYGQISEKPSGLKGKIFNNVGIGLLFPIIISEINLQIKQSAYNNADRIDLKVSVFLPSDLRILLMLDDVAKFNSLRRDLNSAANSLNTSVGIFGILYIVNVFDIIFFRPAQFAGLKQMDTLPLANLEKGKIDFQFSRNNSSQYNLGSSFFMENKYLLMYNYQF